MKFPEIRVTRSGHMVDKVEWDPQKDGAPLFDLTVMHVTEVARVVTADGEAPTVKLTIVARLVEVEAEDVA